MAKGEIAVSRTRRTCAPPQLRIVALLGAAALVFAGCGSRNSDGTGEAAKASDTVEQPAPAGEALPATPDAAATADPAGAVAPESTSSPAVPAAGAPA
ncbi:MAG: hypothetical protein ACRD0O_13000, partial [Acidimicrobiia bacterium]